MDPSWSGAYQSGGPSSRRCVWGWNEGQASAVPTLKPAALFGVNVVLAATAFGERMLTHSSSQLFLDGPRF